MTPLAQKIENKILQLVKGWESYDHTIFWKNSFFSKEELETFNNLAEAGLDREGLNPDLKNLEEIILAAKKIAEDDDYYFFDIFGNDDGSDKFPSSYNTNIQLAFIQQYLNLIKSEIKISFILYGLRDNEVQTIKGKVSRETIQWSQ